MTATTLNPTPPVAEVGGPAVEPDATLLAIPHIEWNPSDTAQKIGTWIGFGIVIIWFVTIIAQFAIPKKHGGRGRISVVGLIFSLCIAVLCMDLSLIPPLLNFIIDAADALIDWVKSITFSG